MKKRFTPGPWSLEEDGMGVDPACTDRFAIKCKTNVGGVLGTVARCGYRYNAQLITATPDLLEALENCIAKLEIVLANYPPYDRGVIKTSRAAIAKALGEIKK